MMVDGMTLLVALIPSMTVTQFRSPGWITFGRPDLIRAPGFDLDC